MDLIQALTDRSLRRDGTNRYKDLIDKYQIPEELQEEFVKAKDILADAYLLTKIASSDEKTKVNPRLYVTEIGKRYIKTALQIQESEALKKIDTIIAQEGYEEQRETILSYISKGRTPIEIAQGLHEVSKKPKIKESNDDGER